MVNNMKMFEYSNEKMFNEDCDKIWEWLNQHGNVNFDKSKVFSLWSEFSKEMYFAEFMEVGIGTLRTFADYLSEKDCE